MIIYLRLNNRISCIKNNTLTKTLAQRHRIKQTAIRYKDLFFVFFFVAIFRTVTGMDVNIINLNVRLLPFL